MAKKEIEALFPRKCMITQELIDGGKHIGTELLKSFLPEELWDDIFWGLSIGTVAGVRLKVETDSVYEGKTLRVPLYLDSHIRLPEEITFELRR